MTRRDLLTRSIKVAGAAIAGIVGIPAAMFAFAPLRDRRREHWQGLGSLDAFPIGEVRHVKVEVPRDDWARSLREKGVYVWHSENEGPVVYSRNCTDLSCPIVHDAGNNWFFCPCHGGIFSTDGRPQAGPPNRPLYRYTSRVRNGILEIDLRSLPPMT